MPARLAGLVFLLVIGELLSAIAVLVLAFAAPKHIFAAVNAFGGFLALRAAAILLYGLARGMLFSRARPIQRNQQPVRFWLFAALNLLGVAIGAFLTQLPIE